MEKLSPIGWAVRPLKHYADFRGRAPRAEYWWYALAISLIGIPITVAERFTIGPVWGDYGPASLILYTAVLIPGFAVTVRRLHDVDRTGWWAVMRLWAYAVLFSGMSGVAIAEKLANVSTGLLVLLTILYLACALIMFIFMVTRGTEGENRYGPDPYGPDPLEKVFE